MHKLLWLKIFHATIKLVNYIINDISVKLKALEIHTENKINKIVQDFSTKKKGK